MLDCPRHVQQQVHHYPISSTPRVNIQSGTLLNSKSLSANKCGDPNSVSLYSSWLVASRISESCRCSSSSLASPSFPPAPTLCLVHPSSERADKRATLSQCSAKRCSSGWMRRRLFNATIRRCTLMSLHVLCPMERSMFLCWRVDRQGWTVVGTITMQVSWRILGNALPPVRSIYIPRKRYVSWPILASWLLGQHQLWVKFLSGLGFYDPHRGPGLVVCPY